MKLRESEVASSTNIRLSASIRGLCSARDVKPEVVGEAVGISKSTIYSRLRVKTPWQADEVFAIASFFDLEVGDLYDGLGGLVGVPGRSSGPLAQSAELRTFNPDIEPLCHVIPIDVLRERRQRRLIRIWLRRVS